MYINLRSTIKTSLFIKPYVTEWQPVLPENILWSHNLKKAKEYTPDVDICTDSLMNKKGITPYVTESLEI